MPGPAQTPTIFVKAGDAGMVFSPDCVKALAACGYEPEDFGTYKEVQDRCSRARERTSAAAGSGIAAPVNPTKDPLAHDRWIAHGQSGHISENTRHQHDRGDNSSSYCPLYDTDMAPCMPHGGMACYKDTQHGAVTNTDIANGNAAAGAVGPGGKNGIERERAMTRDALAAALDWGMDDEQPAAQQMRSQRFAAIAALNASDARIADAAKQGGKPFDAAVKKKYAKNRETALECVEAFFNAQWKEMAKNSKAEKQAAHEDAKKKSAAARAEVKRLEQEDADGKRVKGKLAEARKNLDAAEEHQAQTKSDWDEVKDLNPNDVNKCLGQSRAPDPRGQFTKSAPVADTSTNTDE